MTAFVRQESFYSFLKGYLRMQSRVAVLLLFMTCLAGCATISRPETLGERASGFGYIPLDPLPIDQAKGADSCVNAETMAAATGTSNTTLGNDDVLAKLPDQTIRFAVASFDQTKGSLTFGPATLTAKGNQYRAVLDYIQADAVPVQFWIKRLTQADDAASARPIIQATVTADGRAVYGYDVVTSIAQSVDGDLRATHPGEGADTLTKLKAEALREEAMLRTEAGYQQVTIPVYVGVGLRLSADIVALKSGISISGLSAIGVEAEANRLNGTLTVQSLGVSGKAIATALPLPNKLDQTTIESAILAIGTMRATLYASSGQDAGVNRQPRIVGLYSPVGSDPLLINAIYSELSKQRPRWYTPCIR
ncbi:hypothetical protein [Novosphingobium guangzhouense]|uniref:Uncharacterized protein n=1 Tax=Novosphingobium guangzhouense TaxID=1850347 RepID=A0A2K2G0I9_9SPHN|nr:hypothetical protein [Novosphingobium guangzhouense]PNU04553.1 hypothetical protein A8V01_19255 [Novosphingobium guangzhouense]